MVPRITTASSQGARVTGPYFDEASNAPAASTQPATSVRRHGAVDREHTDRQPSIERMISAIATTAL